jgi:serine/threonine-protein kinase
LSCPKEDELLAFAGGFLPPEDAARTEAHIADCDDCSLAVAEAARDLFGEERSPEEAPISATPSLASGAQLGRYSILGLLGRGAMGVVYSAYDPQLDRRVALKVLRPDHRLAAKKEMLRERLMREGQSMARLSHPNIVAVHDVGALEDDDGIFLTMELVEGQTLRQWLDAEPRDWRAIVDAFLQAAQGLAAAHRAGIVHRDFKPDNVLVGKDGRVRVTDFGLARKEGEAPVTAAAKRLRSLSLTSTGLVVGTPAYMSPEQLRGDAVGAAADLFSFCSALWQALYREHPFENQSFDALKTSVLSGRVRESSTGAVPTFLKRALLRGLRVDPEQRYASMDDLAAALAADPVRRTRRVALAALPLVVAVALVGGTIWSARRARLTCRAGETRLSAVWSDARKGTLRAAFAAVPVVHAAATAGLVERALDDYGHAWTTGYADACEATQMRGEQSAELLDRRMQCLDDRLRSFDALVENFSRADGALVDKAVAAVASLPRIDACANRQRLLALADEPVTPAQRPRVDAARADLARARAANLAGRYQDGLPIARKIVDDKELTQARLIAEARFELARLLFNAGQVRDAQGAMVQAMAQAARAGDGELEARAASEMVALLGFEQKVEEAEHWATLAQGQIEHLGNDLGLRADLASNRGMLLTQAQKAEEAIPHLQEAVTLLEKRVDPHDLAMGTLLERLGIALFFASRYAEAATVGERAVAILRERLGPEHPLTATAMFDLANPIEVLGRRHEGRLLEEQALAIRERNLGPNHREVALSYNNLASSNFTLGMCKEGAAAQARGEAITQRIYGTDHPEMVVAYGIKAQLLGCLGHYDEALVAIRRAEQLVDKYMGANNPFASFAKVIEGALLEADQRYDEAYTAYDRAIEILSKSAPNRSDLSAMLDGKGRMLQRRGRLAEAEALHQRALAIDEKIGPEVPDLIPTLMALGEVARAQKRNTDAVAFAERALKIAEKADIAPLLLAEARLTLARALEAAGTKGRAQPLLAQARGEIVASPYASPDLLRRALERREAQFWL